MRKRPLEYALFCAISVLLLVAPAAHAGQPSMVKDIYPGADPALGLSPRELVAAGPFLYFAGSDSVFGRETWRSDGTAEGTQLVLDIFGGNTYWGGNDSNPEQLTNLDGTVLFTALDGLSGREPWAADSESAQMLGDLIPGFLGSQPSLIAAAGNLAFMVGFTPPPWGHGLYLTDGTAGGTRRVQSAPTSLGTAPGDLAVHGSVAYFVGETSSEGWELWRSDGTENGTHLLKDIGPGYVDSLPASLVFLGDVLYFTAEEVSSNGRELWRSDGTEAGTWRVKDIHPGLPSSEPSALTPVCTKLFFLADDGTVGRELWVSDGTEAGTARVADLAPGPDGIEIDVLGAIDCKLAFTLAQPDTGEEIWLSDGTQVGTAILTDINPGPGDALVTTSTIMGGKLYFDALDGTTGRELWTTDGTPEGTFQVADIAPGSGLPYPASLATVEDAVFFSASDGDAGFELWRSDGTDAGTELVFDSTPPLSSRPNDCLGGSSLVYCGAFTAETGTELWVSDGTEDGTRLTLETDPEIYWDGPWPFATIGDRVLFGTFAAGTYQELWVSDGTENGTVLLAQIDPPDDPNGVALMDEIVYFIEETHGELWRSDGTPSGTYRMAAVDACSDSIATMGGHVYFCGHDAINGNELWRSDGTTTGTTLVIDIDSGLSDSTPRDFTAVNDLVFFTARSPGFGREVWSTDGTAAGTTMAADINSGWDTSEPRLLTPVGDIVCLSALDAAHGYEVWCSDGTTAGTSMVMDICVDPPEGELCEPGGLVAVNDRLFFWQNDGVHGFELWVTDGTPEGTRLTYDLVPGYGSSRLPTSHADAVAYGGRLYYAGPAPGSGVELIATDGTWEGTEVFDLVQGPNSSSVRALAIAGDRLFFAASDSDHGHELWTLDLALFRDGFETGGHDRWNEVRP